MQDPPNEETVMTVEPLDVVYFVILLAGLVAALLLVLGRGREPVRLTGVALLALLAYLTAQFLAAL